MRSMGDAVLPVITKANEELEAMRRHLLVDDAASVVLKGHLWVEELLCRAIGSNVQNAAQPDVRRLNFPKKVHLAHTQGLLTLPEPLLALNHLRNRIAHELMYEVDTAALIEVKRTFRAGPDPDEQRMWEATHDITHKTEPAKAAQQVSIALVAHVGAIAARQESKIGSDIRAQLALMGAAIMEQRADGDEREVARMEQELATHKLRLLSQH
jgi:hypothetical protein